MHAWIRRAGGEARRQETKAPASRRKDVLRFDLEAIAFDIDDAHALAEPRRAAARRPFAVADAHAPPLESTAWSTTDHLAEQPLARSLSNGSARIFVAHRIEAPAADARREEREHGEQRQLQRHADPREQQRDEPGGDRRGADEDEEEAGRDQLGDQQHDAADQPQPFGIDVE